MLFAALAALLSLPQEKAPTPEIRSGAPLELELDAGAPPLAGRGPSRALRFLAAGIGNVSVYALSEDFDPLLRVEKWDGTLLVEDDASGGGTTPFVRVSVEPGQELRIVVASATPERGGRTRLVLGEWPESEDTLTVAAWARGEIESARKLEREAGQDRLRAAIRLLGKVEGAADSAEAMGAAFALAEEAVKLGNPGVSLPAFEAAVLFYERFYPPDHPALVAARLSFGDALDARGEVRLASRQFEAVVASRARFMPAETPELLLLRDRLAKLLRSLGEHERARDVQLEVLRTHLRTQPADSVQLQFARVHLATTLAQLGERAGARALFEQALDVITAQLSNEDPRLAALHVEVARVLDELGDARGASKHLEAVLDVQQRTLPDDHAALQKMRCELAELDLRAGELPRAVRLLEKVVDVRTRKLEANAPQTLEARGRLAAALRASGELARARKLQEEVLDSFSLVLPPTHAVVLGLRSDLAATLALAGEGARARDELAAVLAAVGQSAGPADLLRARANLLWALVDVRDVAAVRKLASEIHASALAGLRDTAARSPREAEALAARISAELSTLLSVAGGSGAVPASAELDREAFLLLETARGAAVRRANTLRVAPPVSSKRIAASKRAPQVDDRADARAIAAALGDGEAAVFFQEYTFDDVRGKKGAHVVSGRMLAFVLAKGSPLARVELGEVAAIASAVADWRAAVLESSSTPEREREAAARVRKLVFDPLRSSLGGARRVQVSADGVLHQVALDALPDEQGCLGERLEIVGRAALAPLASRSATPGYGALLLVGAIDYDAEPEPRAEASAPARSRALRLGGAPGKLAPMPATAGELDDLAQLGAQAFGESAHVVRLEARAASREALLSQAPGSRFVYVAAHAWLAPDAVPAFDDSVQASAKLPLIARGATSEPARGVSPLSLCGLALAGANRPADVLARLEGVVTADELASLDLSHCELAVLACRAPSVGSARAGQGVAALRLALHAAGARHVVASLWDVGDEPTRELLVDFQRRVWLDKTPVARALWEAKSRMRELRDEAGVLRYSVRDWAGFVLSVEP